MATTCIQGPLNHAELALGERSVYNPVLHQLTTKNR